MYHLATVAPVVRRVRLPLTRDQLMLLMAAINEIFLSIDIFLAHDANGQIKPAEAIPIYFGVTAGVLLLAAGLLAFRRRGLATVLANVVFLASIIVGVMGMYFHISRTVFQAGSAFSDQAVNILIWAPPVLGPFVFALVGVLGMSAAWIESPTDSGRLKLLGSRTVQMPYSKTRAYFFIVAIGSLVTVISSVLDHARLNFDNPWVWLPTMAGVFGTVVAFTLGIIERPTRADLTAYTAAMLLLILVGVVGWVFHVRGDLTAGGAILVERFLRGAPFLAPLLFANMGLLGLVVLLDPAETSA
jgi:hypothetical protein